ncbi:MAG TPA: hypothetical protein VM011_11165 [Gammaproteobacteria bacterium]|nr:hypothetical protein [Gammaproteobacteria bacterium]
MNIVPRSLLAAVVALSLAVPGMASADRRGDGYRNHGDRHGYKHDGYRKHYRERHHDRRYSPGGYGTRYYYYDDGHDDLLLGLAVGGLLGYAIPRYPNYYYYDRY